MESATTTDEFAAIENDAAAELHNEYTAAARKRIKKSLKAIADSEKITHTLRLDHAALMADIRSGHWEAKTGRYGYED